LIVVDASAIVDLVLGTAEGALVEERLDQAGGILHAPHLLDVEVMQAIRRCERHRVVPASRALEALRSFSELPIRRHEHALLLPRVWELRTRLTAYDAIYVALAEALELPLLTRDKRLARAPEVRAMVEVL
jgi:predicted nucleic acid-binding protein